MVLAVSIAACVLLGGLGYLLGANSGEDLDVARSQGAIAGRAEGLKSGEARGVAVGRRIGFRKGFNEAYAPAYRSAYAADWEDAGLDSPAKQEIEVPPR